MEIILLENVLNLGRLGDKVRVKPGYGRNYLIPYGMAVAATAGNLQQFEQRRAELEQKARDTLTNAEKRAEQLATVELTVTALASEEGKLYGSVGVNEICKALLELGHEVKKNEIILPKGAIHEVGQYDIRLQLHSEVRIKMPLEVIAGQAA